MNHKIILIILFWCSLPVFAQTRVLPDFTGLIDKHGAAVVNISTVQTRPPKNKMIPGMPNIPRG